MQAQAISAQPPQPCFTLFNHSVFSECKHTWCQSFRTKQKEQLTLRSVFTPSEHSSLEPFSYGKYVKEGSVFKSPLLSLVFTGLDPTLVKL